MASLNDLDYTNNMAPSKKPFLTDLEETLDSIQTYINDKLTANINQAILDIFPTAYAFDDDGVKQFTTYNLYDKQSGVNSYTGGDITIASTGAWTDVDTSNAQITFTPDLLTGDFSCIAQFSLNVVTTNATNQAVVRFRLTDGSTNSTRIANVNLVSGVNATTTVVPITLYHQFNNLTGNASQTIKLQYFIATTTATTIVVEANTNSPLVMNVEKI